MSLCQQAERVLLGFVLDNVPVHQQQVRRGRSAEALVQLRGLGKKAHLEAVRENLVDIIQDCRITIENDDMRAALALSLH